MPDIFEKIRGIICEQLGKEPDEIKMETNLKEDLNADSLDIFQVVNDIEDELNVKIDTTEGLETVGDVVKFVEAQLK